MNDSQEFLLQCLNSSASSDALPQDWPLFLETAYKEGVSALLYYNIKDHEIRHSFPEDVLAKLEREYMINSGRNMLIEDQIEEICQKLEEKEMQALIVRGAVFFTDLYPALGIRPMIDIDFIIRKEDLDVVLSMFKELGYQYNKSYPYFLEKDDFYVDLHLDSINFWRIKSWPSRMSIKDEAIWSRTKEYRRFHHVRSLGVYDTILSCCDHLQKHSFDRLIWFLDVACLINNEEEFDWKKLMQRAQQFNLVKPAYYVVSYLKEMELISTNGDEWAGSVRLNRFEQRSLRLLLSNQRSRLSGELLSISSITTFQKRLEFLKEVIFVKDESFPLIREKLNFWHYVKRFFRLMFHFSSKAVSVYRPM